MLMTVLAEFQSRPKVPKYALTCIHTVDRYTSYRAKNSMHTHKLLSLAFCRYEDVCSLDIIVTITFLVHTLQAGLELPTKGQNH